MHDNMQYVVAAVYTRFIIYITQSLVCDWIQLCDKLHCVCIVCVCVCVQHMYMHDMTLYEKTIISDQRSSLDIYFFLS